MLRFLRLLFAALVALLIGSLPTLGPAFGGDLSPPLAWGMTVTPVTTGTVGEMNDLTFMNQGVGCYGGDERYQDKVDHPLRA